MKKLLSFLLTAVMLFGVLSVPGLAEDVSAIVLPGTNKPATVSSLRDSLTGLSISPDNPSVSYCGSDDAACAEPLPRSDECALW